MIGEHFADDRWPCARQPSERSFRALHSPDSAAQKIASLVHGEPDSITAQRAKDVTKEKRKKLKIQNRPRFLHALGNVIFGAIIGNR